MANLLVVDDDTDLGRLLQTALERDGHRVEVKTSGGQLTEALCRWADCILLDVMMPAEDGFERTNRRCWKGWASEPTTTLQNPSALRNSGQGCRRICGGRTGRPRTAFSGVRQRLTLQQKTWR